MFDAQIGFGLVTLVIGIISYSFYFIGIFRHKAKPDGFSWLIWGILAAITYFAQAIKGAGPGAWATALTAVACLVIAITAFTGGSSKSKPMDWMSLMLALAGLVVWKLTHDPLWAVVMVVIAGGMGFVPTFFKAYRNPREETAITYFLNAIKFAIALLVLKQLNVVTMLYPFSMVAMNVSLASLIYLRRARQT